MKLVYKTHSCFVFLSITKTLMCLFSLCYNVVFDARLGGGAHINYRKNELITMLAHWCLPPCSLRAVSMCLSVCVHLWFHCCSDGRVGQLTYGCAL